MAVGKRMRQLHRYRKIATALVRNGLGALVQELGFHEWFPFLHRKERLDVRNKSIGERIRMMLEELGPTFVKLGQIASTRPDLIPPSILKELESLQDDVPAYSYEEAVAIIEQELGAPMGRMFRQFDRTPLAAASIGQVYQAELHDGTKVAVKVQRPNIERMIITDLEILADWARIAEHRIDWARRYRLGDIVEELGRALRQELDYMTEARNAEKFHQQSKAWKHVHVPKVYWDYCTSRILTMEFREGIRLSDLDGLVRAGIDRQIVAERLASVLFQQILIEGFFHGDPHPGNVLVLHNGDLVLLDFGMVGRLTPAMKKHFTTFIIALRNQSTKGVIRAISSMGIVPEGVKNELLYADVEELREKYYKVPLKNVSLGEAVRDLLDVAHRHRIHIPTELTLLSKSLLTLEGVVTSLDPNFRVFDVAEPFGKKLFAEQFSPQRVIRRWLEQMPEYIDLLREVPLTLKQLTSMMQRGQVKVEVAVPQTEELMNRLDRISNRLSFSVVLLSLSIVMVGIVVGASLRNSDIFLWRFPVIEIGFIAVLFLFFWLILSILRSGRF